MLARFAGASDPGKDGEHSSELDRYEHTISIRKPGSNVSEALLASAADTQGALSDDVPLLARYEGKIDRRIG